MTSRQPSHRVIGVLAALATSCKGCWNFDQYNRDPHWVDAGIPILVTSAPVSEVACYDRFGNTVYRHVSAERTHVLTRLACHQWLRCCISDPWVDGQSEDTRAWGVGYEGQGGEESAVSIDGVGVTCVIIKGYLP